jgi:ABC-type uncharacterized transport system permease subunit
MKRTTASGKSILAHVVALAIGLPLAFIVGGFAGWAMGSTVGEWIEYSGITEAKSIGGSIGGLFGAVICAVIVVIRLRRHEGGNGP